MNYGRDNDTIIAQCTPQANGAIALLRLSGENVLSIVDKMSKLTNNKLLSEQSTHTIHYGWICDQDEQIIDQVLFFIMKSPHTFTGDDTVEITCHNNSFIIQNIINCAIKAGTRSASNGEFSRRAVLNNKMDILQAEAINDLIHANTQHALRQSLSQLQGSFTQWVSILEEKLIKAFALSEASFEFIDEENMEFSAQINEILVEIIEKIICLKRTFDCQKQIREGVRIAFIGSVNAGKSSLFNALLDKERSIVTNIAGTTRDTIEAALYKDGNYITFIDTAGLRETDDVIEQLGIKKSYEEAQLADIILIIFDGSQSLSYKENKIYNNLIASYANKIIVVQNKFDLPQKKHELIVEGSIYCVSSVTKKNIEFLNNAIEKKVSQLFQSIESPFLLNKRHYGILLSLEDMVYKILPMLTDNTSYELVSYHLKDTISVVSELTGKSISEKGMDAIFREFCVGK